MGEVEHSWNSSFVDFKEVNGVGLYHWWTLVDTGGHSVDIGGHSVQPSDVERDADLLIDCSSLDFVYLLN